MKKEYLKKIKIPDNPGVYFFKKKDDILYIGKATSLRDRTKSYFSKDLINTRGPAIVDMVTLSDNLSWQETDSVLEALIIEANLIKKYKPKYNTKEKDDKSFNYVVITKGQIPRILVIRGRNLKQGEYQSIYGPFINGGQLKEAMKIIRRIFPYFDNDSLKKNNKEFYRQLGLIPISYKTNIKNLKLFFQGKKKSVIANLKKQMISLAREKRFEEANEIKKRIFALEHINDISLIKKDIDEFSNEKSIRIEAYDVAHMSGKNMVGVMTVIENGEVQKSEYRKFIIRTQPKANDTGALKEILTRRFNHIEWKYPDIIVVDGGRAQINTAKKYSPAIISVLKDEKHKAKAIIGNEKIIKEYKNSILLANSEAHRFAISFHKERRNKNFIL